MSRTAEIEAAKARRKGLTVSALEKQCENLLLIQKTVVQERQQIAREREHLRAERTRSTRWYAERLEMHTPGGVKHIENQHFGLQLSWTKLQLRDGVEYTLDHLRFALEREFRKFHGPGGEASIS